MKKLIVLMLTLLATGVAFALPLGNPLEPALMKNGLIWEGLCADYCDPCVSWLDAISFRAGFYGDYVFKRHFEIAHDDLDTKGSILPDNEINTNALYLVSNVFDLVDVFGILGVSNFNFETNAREFGNPASTIFILESESAFSWGVGARAFLFEWRCLCFGVEGQYFSFDVPISRMTLGESSTIYPSDEHVRYQEYQFGAGLSYRIANLIPYIGVKWARANAALPEKSFTFANMSTVTLVDINNYFDWGFCAGISLIDCEKAFVTVEGRWLDERAVYVNGQFRF